MPLMNQTVIHLIRQVHGIGHFPQQFICTRGMATHGLFARIVGMVHIMELILQEDQILLLRLKAEHFLEEASLEKGGARYLTYVLTTLDQTFPHCICMFMHYNRRYASYI